MRTGIEVGIRSTLVLTMSSSNKDILSVCSSLEPLHAALTVPGGLREMLERVHRALETLLDASNFYVGMYDPASGLWVFPYSEDEDEDVAPQAIPGSLTDYVRLTGKPLLCNGEVEAELQRAGHIVGVTGQDSETWLGAPLITASGVIGTMAVQSYVTVDPYSDADVAILATAARIISFEVERRWAVRLANSGVSIETRRAGAPAGDEAGASRVTSRFLSNVSHELRTPLSQIIGYTELLDEQLEGMDGGEGPRRDVERILSASEHLKALIEDLLDIAQLDDAPVSPTTFPVGDLLDDAVGLLGTDLAIRGNRIVRVGFDGVGIIRTDRSKLTRAVSNLVANACRFTEEGTISVRVRRVKRGEADWLRLEVSDTGEGIDSASLNGLFDPFSRLAVVAADEAGPGIGLAITRHHCTLLGGEVHVASIPGGGSSFTLEIPLS